MVYDNEYKERAYWVWRQRAGNSISVVTPESACRCNAIMSYTIEDIFGAGTIREFEQRKKREVVQQKKRELEAFRKYTEQDIQIIRELENWRFHA